MKTRREEKMIRGWVEEGNVNEEVNWSIMEWKLDLKH